MSTYEYGTTAGSSYTLSLSPGPGKPSPSTPKGLIVTAAAQTTQGWFGQVFVDEEIVWESKPKETSGLAVRAANQRVVDMIKGLFGWTPPQPATPESGE